MTLQPADIEGALVAYLSPLLGVHVGTKVPNPAPDAFIRVTRTGGGRQSIIEERPTMLFEVWAADSVEALTLAAQCWRHVNDCEQTFIADGVWCTTSEPSSPINFPDPNYETRDRYQFYAPMIISLEEIA